MTILDQQSKATVPIERSGDGKEQWSPSESKSNIVRLSADGVGGLALLKNRDQRARKMRRRLSG